MKFYVYSRHEGTDLSYELEAKDAETIVKQIMSSVEFPYVHTIRDERGAIIYVLASEVKLTYEGGSTVKR